MLNSITVRDYMTRHLLTFHAETDLFTAIDRLLEHRVHAAPVVERGVLVGVLSRRDALRAIKAFAQHDASRLA